MESSIRQNEYGRWVFEIKPDSWKRYTARSVDSYDSRPECNVALEVLLLGQQDAVDGPPAETSIRRSAEHGLRPPPHVKLVPKRPDPPSAETLSKRLQAALDDAKEYLDPVSYTHLTLPTICSV